MTQLPFPGLVTDEERSNFESVEFHSVIKFVYFTFDTRQIRQSKVIIKLPNNSMIYGIFTFRVEDAFDGTELTINIGTDTIDDILILPIQAIGIYITNFIGTRSKHLEPFVTDTLIKVTLNYTGVKPTMGKGWGIMQWLDLNRLKGF